MYVCTNFRALITALVLCAKSQDSLLSVSVRRVLVVFSTVLDSWAEESRVLRHVTMVVESKSEIPWRMRHKSDELENCFDSKQSPTRSSALFGLVHY